MLKFNSSIIISLLIMNNFNTKINLKNYLFFIYEVKFQVWSWFSYMKLIIIIVILLETWQKNMMMNFEYDVKIFNQLQGSWKNVMIKIDHFYWYCDYEINWIFLFNLLILITSLKTNYIFYFFIEFSFFLASSTFDYIIKHCEFFELWNTWLFIKHNK